MKKKDIAFRPFMNAEEKESRTKETSNGKY
jgi:hypothetical protein